MALLIPLREAVALIGRESTISQPKREANWLWERLRNRERRKKLGLPSDPSDPYTTFPARKDGKKWMVHREELLAWLVRSFGKPA